MKNELVGWDDGNIYYYDRSGKEFCVSERSELMRMLVAACAEYFARKEA